MRQPLVMLLRSCWLCCIAAAILVVAAGELVEVVQLTRPFGTNTIQLQCRETFLNGTTTTANDVELFRFNHTDQRVVSLLESKAIAFQFSTDTGILTFDIQQDIEGAYYCSRDPVAGIPSSHVTLVARPRPEAVQIYYEKKVGESVIIRSGVGEGALASHYTAVFYKNGLTFTNVSRGEDFSLKILSLELSDSGTYKPSISITTGSGDIYLVPNLPIISLIVYKSPTIEVAPESLVTNEERTSVSLTCIVTGAPFLRIAWVKGERNLTKQAPTHYSINRTVINGGEKVLSMLIIHRPTYTDSGTFTCIATIMNGGRDGERFKVQESADLTVIESEFFMKTVITEYQQIQLWVRLHTPISLYPVTAMVYFTPAANPDQEPQRVQTHSIVANTTVMVFQLEAHDVPENFEDKDFYIQVALRVNSVESDLVPNSLDMANTANLNEPTEDECSQKETHRTAIIVTGVVILFALLIITLNTFCIGYFIYNCYKKHQHIKRQANISEAEKLELLKQAENYTQQALIAEGENKKILLDKAKNCERYVRGNSQVDGSPNVQLE